LGEADPDTFTCGICGFVMNSLGECPRCKMQDEDNVRRWEQRALFDEVREFLGGDE
jgi:tRNA(Ile2) C34 agmatinyltransferase TiaS